MTSSASGVALAVGDQHLDPGRRTDRADRFDGGGEAGGAAVGEVVAGDAGDHRVLEPEGRDRVGDPPRLVGVEREWPARVDETEAARAGAPIAQDHERRGVVGPALVDVRAARFLAHGVEIELLDQSLRLAEVGAEIGAHPHPFGTARARGLHRFVHSGLGEPAEQAHRRAAGRSGVDRHRRTRERAQIVGVLTPHDVLALDVAVDRSGR